MSKKISQWPVATTFSPGDVVLGNSGGATKQIGYGVLFAAYVRVSDTKPNQTPGGTFTQGAWQTRDLNTEDSDDAGLCSIAANQITLAAGTYRCNIVCPSAGVLQNKARLYNVTGSTTLLYGTQVLSDSTAGGLSIITGQFTVAAAQTLEVQHVCRQTFATYGFGAGASGVLVGFGPEVYTVAEFWRVG